MQIKTITPYEPVFHYEDEEHDLKEDEVKFSDLLEKSLDKVNQMQKEKEEYKNLLIMGEVDNLHDVTIAAEKANIALQMTLSIRNKMVEAYKEIMRMQI